MKTFRYKKNVFELSTGKYFIGFNWLRWESLDLNDPIVHMPFNFLIGYMHFADQYGAHGLLFSVGIFNNNLKGLEPLKNSVTFKIPFKSYDPKQQFYQRSNEDTRP